MTANDLQSDVSDTTKDTGTDIYGDINADGIADSNMVMAADVVDLDSARDCRPNDDPGPSGPDGPVIGSEDERADDANDIGDDVDEDVASVPVDRPDNTKQPLLSADRLEEAERRPILPPWLRSATEARTTLWWAARLAAHMVAYHVTRSPKYLFRLLARAPRGGWRLVRGVVRWVFDLENEPLRQACARSEDIDTYLKLVKERDRHVRWRGIVTAILLPVAAIGVTVALWLTPNTVLWSIAGAAVLVLGIVGRPADRPLLDTAVTMPAAPRLTSDMVTNALSALRIAPLTAALAKEARAVRFVAPIHRDGPGFRVEIDLPQGVVATDVIEQRERLAANLSRPLGCVWLDGNTEVHPGRLVIWVGDKELAKIKQPAWPLAKRGKADLFAPIPFGIDPRGRPVTITLMFAAMVIGAVPRIGKTAAARVLVLAAALDPRVRLYLFDLKGMGDFGPLEPVAHRCRAGSEDEDIVYTLEAAKELWAEIQRRAKYMRSLPRHLCPESKITPELASDPKHRLFPILLMIDETQLGFDHRAYGKELTEVCQDIARVGPAAGVISIFATQRPDARSLPGGIGSNAILRFCLLVKGQLENDMVLGTSAYKNGVRATQFTRRDKGIGILDGEGTDPEIVRTYFIDGPAADAIVARARTIREAAGTLSGHALGIDEIEQTAARYSLLHDIAAACAVGGGEEGRTDGKYWSATVLGRLTEAKPDIYTGWKPTQLAAALKPFGVGTVQVNRRTAGGKQSNQRGIDVHDIHEAITRHTSTRKTSTESEQTERSDAGNAGGETGRAA